MGMLTTVEWSLWDPIVLILSVILSWVFVHHIYNLYFHPLAHVPGPFLGRMSQWPSAYYAKKGIRHRYIINAFKKYGNKIRIEPNTVLFRSPTAYQAIYSSKANVKRGQFYDSLVRHEDERSTITTTDNAAHAKRRKLLNQAFTEKSLRASSVFMEKHIDRWNELLVSDTKDKGWSAPINVADRVDTLVFDILGDICYGKSFEIKEPGENPIKAIPHATVQGMQFIYTITKSPLLGLIPHLRPYGLDKLLKAMRSPDLIFYDNFVHTSVTERLQRNKSQSQSTPPREDMFHFISKAVNPDTGLPSFSDKDIEAEARLLIVAGSDTTSVTMCGLLFYLAYYPDVHAKLLRELEGAFDKAEDVTPGPALSSCKYLRACIDETLRICPSGLAELPREVLPGGLIIEGEYYPAGVTVGTAAWPECHNEEVYGDPEIYRPERWIVSEPSEGNPHGNSKEEVARIKANFHPFSIGPFACAGTNFALQELMLMGAKTVLRLEFRVAEEERGRRGRDGNGVPLMDDLTDAYIAVKKGPVMQFRSRGVGRE